MGFLCHKWDSFALNGKAFWYREENQSMLLMKTMNVGPDKGSCVQDLQEVFGVEVIN